MRGLAVAAAVAGGACVEPFRGSNIQIDFSSATHVAGTPGGSLLPNQPPAGTYYTLYGADQVRAADGTVSQVFLFEIQRFEVRPLVDINSPCYIDRAGTPYPGLHATQFFAKTAADAGIADPLAPPAGADPEVVSRVLTAQARAQRIAALTTYKVVTSASDARYPALAATCVDDDASAPAAEIPAPTCTGPLANTRRLALCEAFWAGHPDHFEGTDRVLTSPLSGTFFGPVTGINPITSAPTGGTSMYVDEVADLDAYAINWQFKDLDGVAGPDYPATFADADKSAVGYPYMTGLPEARTRGVINVRLRNAVDPAIAAEMAIFPGLGTDDVQF
ncbi:MAG: hypothetical protein KA297_27355 [Kofleriaceae bacterium]|nr:hypothetical protein [Kofleriaceae bacterium]